MASSESSHSNAVMDISHVLESLGSLIGELDAIEIDKVDEVKSCEDSHGISDLSLETLLADTDEFDDDEKQFLIPHQSSPIQKAQHGFFGHMNSTTQGHEKTTSDLVYVSPAGSRSSHSLQSHNSVPLRTQVLDSHYAVPPGTRARGVSTSQFSSLQPQTYASLRTQEHDNHYSVPPSIQATGINNSQCSSVQTQMSASLRTPKNDNHFPVPTGTTARGINTSQSSSLQSHNTGSLKSQAHSSHYSVPPSRHKGASKEVALSVEVHGNFKKFDEGSGAAGAAAAQKKTNYPASLTKAEPNHYVSPGELGLLRSSQVNKKANDGGSSNNKQIKQGGHISQEVPVNVFNEEDKPVGLLVTSSMKAREACHKLVLLNKVEDDPQWVLVEYLTDLGLERCCEDHENVMAILKTWAPGSNNKLLFRKNDIKYHFFAHTSNYFPPHLLDSENSDKAVTEKAQKAKTILHQKLFSTCTRVPEVEGNLYCKEFGKKSWSKKFIFLRGSGIYSSIKGKSKASKDLECYVQFDGANLYNILNPKKSHKAPTEFCFCIVPFRARELKELKCFCVDDEKTLMSWNMAVRIAKFGPQLRQNYDDMLRKFAKLTKYRDQHNSSSSHTNVISERVDGEINSTSMKEGQVAMDFTGETGRVITDSKEIQELANTRPKVKLSRRTSSQNFIPTDTAISGHQFMSESWYHGRITRERSLELLMNAGVQDGLFLVRESSSVAGVFVLTFCMNRRVYHCQLVQDIGEDTQTFFSLGKGPAFKTLQELIHFYQQKPLNGVSLALKIPCPKAEYSGYLEA